MSLRVLEASVREAVNGNIHVLLFVLGTAVKARKAKERNQQGHVHGSYSDGNADQVPGKHL